MKHAEAILNRLGIHEYTVDGDEYKADCIFCDNQKKNLQINFVKKLFHCWACNSGGTVMSMIRKITGLEGDDAIRLFRLDEVDIERNIELVFSLMKQEKPKFYNHRQFITPIRFARWNKRGITRKSVKEFELGYDKMTKRLVVPLISGIRCVGLSRRATNKNQVPKYLNTKNFNKQEFIYGYHNIDLRGEYIMLTEGALDAIMMRQMGFNSVALMGTVLSAENAERIMNDFDKVMLMMDNDAAGKLATEEISKRLLEEGISVYTVNYNKDDPGNVNSLDDIESYEHVNLL